MTAQDDPSKGLQHGQNRVDTFVVEAEHSAPHVGSGSVPVLATPWLIAYMERTAYRLVAEALPDNYTSVGTLVNIQHLSPTPIGKKVTVEARIEEITGRRILLAVQAHDEAGEIGRGEHQRVAVQTARFIENLEMKM
jgi:predicted thioesterase